MSMRSVHLRYALLAGVLCAGLAAAFLSGLFADHPAPGASTGAAASSDVFEITYPLDGAVFPPEIIAPVFRWVDPQAGADTWLVEIEFEDAEPGLEVTVREKRWTPSDGQWQDIKRRSREAPARIRIARIDRTSPETALAEDGITIGTSKDEVGAPLFYREVNLPFAEAVKDPSHIRWRLGEVSSRSQPPIIMEKLPVCGNCHSFSADGTVLGMDVDYANDKGSFAIAPVAEEMVLDKDVIISWSTFRKEDRKATFGLLSQVSPDGRYAISTVKDRSVFVATPGLEFSQLFFPIQGILAFYDRQSREFHALPGADDPSFVQSNPTWSPDGGTLVFARSKTHRLDTAGDHVLLTEEECREFLEGGKTFLFDLYRIPFNDGEGGKPEPIPAASGNGMSNYFARYSPDGKWIVFCRAKSFMLLQPDSELYIMPAGGGEARRMRCNTSRMNSWHSWSPNSRWLVFTSKANGPYTQLWLTHIDEEGRSTPPVVLSQFTSPDRAANIPEFLNAEPGAIKRMSERFLDDYSFVRAGNEFLRANDTDGAEGSFRRALEINPSNSNAHNGLAMALGEKGLTQEAIDEHRKALEFNPENASAHANLGTILGGQGKLNEALGHLRRAIAIDPGHFHAHNNLGTILEHQGKFEQAIEHYKSASEVYPRNVTVQFNWGNALMSLGRAAEAVEHYGIASEIYPRDPTIHFAWGNALMKLGKTAEAAEHYRKTIEANPRDVNARHILGVILVSFKKIDEGISHLREALELDPGNAAVRRSLEQALLQRRAGRR